MKIGNEAIKQRDSNHIVVMAACWLHRSSGQLARVSPHLYFLPAALLMVVRSRRYPHFKVWLITA